jgi:O-antigen/teichoic acid export membrane protein
LSADIEQTTDAQINREPAPELAHLGTHSARGLVYLFAGTTASKVVSFVTQIILLYLLGKQDFGIVYLAMTITAFVQVIELGGVGDVLVCRKAFRQWAIPGFWLALTLGMMSCALIQVSAPIASAIYGKNPLEREQLFWVLMILAPSSLANALAVVPRAQLSRNLQFRVLAIVNLANFTLQKVLTVVLAALKFGPYSFVVPTPISLMLTAGFLWWWTRAPWAPQPRLRRWRYLIGDSTKLFSAEFGRALLDQSDYMTLGIFRSVAEVGVYAVGFIFSIQMIAMLMINMSAILFPAFTKLKDQPQKQLQGFLKAQRILAMLGVSGCLLQAAIADPFARFAFPYKWEPSIIVMQILSLGMATRMISGASYSLLKSQGRFNTVLINRWAFVLLQVAALVATLAMGGGVAAVAVVVSIVASLIGPITFHSAIQPYGLGWRDLGEILSRPLVCGILSVGAAWLIAQWMAGRGFGPLPQLVETVVVAVALNILLAWLWMRPVWDDLWLRVRRLMPQSVRA